MLLHTPPFGCGSAVLSGGKCGPGALSAGVSSFSGHVLPKFGFEGDLIARSVVGGLSSMAGGGKFGNGAVTAAFGYLFNEFAHSDEERGYPATSKATTCSFNECMETGYTGDPTSPWLETAAVGAFFGRISFAIYDTINWLYGGIQQQSIGRLGGIPENWVESASAKGGGKVYTNPRNSHDSVRIMPGNRNSPNPAQRVPYVKDNLNGRFLTTEGGRIPNGRLPETHIPLKDYKFGR